MHLFGCLIFLFFAVILFLIAFAFEIVRLFFPFLFPKRKSTFYTGGFGHTHDNQQAQQQDTTHESPRSSQRKIIRDDEGEYVDFEDVKEP